MKDNIIKNNKDQADDNVAANKANDPNIMTQNGYGIDNGTMTGTPVLTSVAYSGGTFTIVGTLNSAPSSQFELEFFSDMIDEREGEFYLGDYNVTTDGTGYASFTASVADGTRPPGDYIDATATGMAADGWTSEFSYDYDLSGGSSTIPVPTVSTVSPMPGSTGGGNVVTITGTGFSAPYGVYFGDTLATSVTINSDTTMTVSAHQTMLV